MQQSASNVLQYMNHLLQTSSNNEELVVFNRHLDSIHLGKCVSVFRGMGFIREFHC